MKTAILVDGSFFIKRYRTLFANWREHEPNKVARSLYAGLLTNLRKVNEKGNGGKRHKELYRIFFYDCPPLEKRVQNPVSKKVLALEILKKLSLEMHSMKS